VKNDEKKAQKWCEEERYELDWEKRIYYLEEYNIQGIKAEIQKGLRPTLPRNVPPVLATLIRSLWQKNPRKRPSMSSVVKDLLKIIS